MGHFAKVLDGKVTQVIVAEPEFFDTFVDTSPGTWLATSYNTHGGIHATGGEPLRANFAGLGFTYDAVNDVFYAPQPYPSWTIAAPAWLWEAPTPYPNDGKDYIWDESVQDWALISSKA
jgi:hypothetical protein